MGKGLPRSMVHANQAKGALQTRHFVMDALAIEIDGASGEGWGTAVVGDFPEGNILFLGAVAYVQFSGPVGDAGLSDTFDGDWSFGTTPADDGTLAGDDVDLIPSTTAPQATAEIGVRTRATHAVGVTGAVYDNTDNSLEINVNALVDDADISADDIPCTMTGTLSITYLVLADD